MADNRRTGRLGMLNFLVVMLSAVIGVLLFEAICHFLLPPIDSAQLPDQIRNRIVFFEGRDTIFQNHEDIFTYLPQNDVRNVTGFVSDNAFSVEYDYRFRTNNFGLVQDTDVVPERDSILLLGDSFTEGQGAEPWFRLVSPEIGKLGYQAVNGGLLGTGFEQWLKLDRYLEVKNIRIRKLVVLFISDDYHRPVWNFTPSMLQCLSVPPLCNVKESYYYRLPAPEELSSWVAKIKAARKSSGPGAYAEALLPASYQIYRYLKRRLKEQVSVGPQQSRAAIAELIRLYGSENVIFVHLPQKEENGEPNELGLQARRSIQDAGGKLFDGFKLCRLSAEDYYANDPHPNSLGYAKIASCVVSIIRQVTAAAP